MYCFFDSAEQIPLKSSAYFLKEVRNMPNDLSVDTIQELFFQQIKKLTLQSLEDSFDLQYSDEIKKVAV